MNVIENKPYHKLCLFYKGEISEAELTTGEDALSANDAINYGLGNWYLYNGNDTKAKGVYYQIMENKGWNSFGYIAAEADLALAFD